MVAYEDDNLKLDDETKEISYLTKDLDEESSPASTGWSPAVLCLHSNPVLVGCLRVQLPGCTQNMKVFSGIQGEKTILVALGDPEPGPPVVSQVRDGDDSHQLADISIGWDGRPALGSSLSCTPLSTNISLETSELDLGRLVEEEDDGLPGGDDKQQTPTADGEYLPQVQAYL